MHYSLPSPFALAAIYQASNRHPGGEKSCGDKALIHIASPVGGLYQGVVFGRNRWRPGERNGE
jgi:hypothetical protein